MPKRAVISTVDVSSIYELPLWLHEQGLDDIAVEQLHLPARSADLEKWHAVVKKMGNPRAQVTVAMVGKYVDHSDAYKSLTEAIAAGGWHQHIQVQIDRIDSERIEREGTQLLEHADAILVPGGFGPRGIEGKIAAARYAREHRMPYLGICLGMQVGVVEFARNVAGLDGAHSTEMDSRCDEPVIALITEWKTESGEIERRDENSDLGGTMRLGAQECLLETGTLARKLYGEATIRERHRHRFEFNNNYLAALSDKGMIFSGRSRDGLVEIVELPDHPWYLGCQFHPEFTSSPRDSHPLFLGFIKAALQNRAEHPAVVNS